MPTLTLQISNISSYSGEVKDRLVKALTTVVAGITQTSTDRVNISFDTASTDNGTQPENRAQAQAQAQVATVDPIKIVNNYLSAMEQRDLEEAGRYLASDFVMSFPASGELRSLEQLVDWSRGRYRFVRKTISTFNVAYEADRLLVFTHGTLHGEWPDGQPFNDVRFIDRFEIQNGQLTRQDVWNDLSCFMPTS